MTNFVGDVFDPYKIIQPLCTQIAYILPSFITANMVTLFGVIAILYSVYIYITNNNYEFRHLCIGMGLLINHLCDDLDGILARYRKQSSKRGEFLDHGSDRLIFMLLYYVVLWDNHVFQSNRIYLVNFIVIVEAFTGVLKNYSNIVDGVMTIDASGEWLRTIGAWYHIILSFVAYNKYLVVNIDRFVAIVFVLLATKQLYFQMKLNAPQFKRYPLFIFLAVGIQISHYYLSIYNVTEENVINANLTAIIISSMFLTYVSYIISSYPKTKIPVHYLQIAAFITMILHIVAFYYIQVNHLMTLYVFVAIWIVEYAIIALRLK